MNAFNFQGNWVDLALILFIFLYVKDGWDRDRGFIVGSFDLVSFVGGFLLAFKTYPWAAQLFIKYFDIPLGIAKAIGFLAVGLVGEQIIFYLSRIIIEKVPRNIRLHSVNRLLGFIPITLNALILVAFASMVFLGLPLRGNIKTAVGSSKIIRFTTRQAQGVEKAIGSIFNEALSESLNFITITPESRETVSLNFTQSELSIDPTSEQQMLILVNMERRQRGVPELVMDERLRDLAREYAMGMFRRGYFSHYNPEGQSPFDRMNEADISYITAGENLAFAPTVTIAHEGLMNSPGHRANILHQDFGHVGIGVIDGGIYGKMFVQEFTD